MQVCDRCKKNLDTNKQSDLNGEKFDLCSACADHIVNHIRRFKPKGNALNKLFGN